tara:strand:- start:44 stop:166 length:123 start_codon:yes stop_codon:yes gene_type:complete
MIEFGIIRRCIWLDNKIGEPEFIIEERSISVSGFGQYVGA